MSEPTREEMNLLMDAGLISDNCVTWADVAEVDRERALHFLRMVKHGVDFDLSAKS